MPIYRLGTVDYYLERAQTAVNYVKSKMVDGAANKIGDILSSGFDSLD